MNSRLRRFVARAQEWAERAQDDWVAAEEYADEVAHTTVRALIAAGHLAAPDTPEGQVVDVERLLYEMALPTHNFGFTLSPTRDQHGAFLSPKDGHHCVALPGADVPFAWTPPPSDPSVAFTVPTQEVQLFTQWIAFMSALIDTGHAWIGGYRPDTDNFETEIALVFLPELGPEACDSATAWKQRSIWTVIKGHPDGGQLTSFNLVPCKSVFLAALRHRRNQRRIRPA